MLPDDADLVALDGYVLGDEVLSAHDVVGRIVGFRMIRGARKPFGPYDEDEVPSALIDDPVLGQIQRMTSSLALRGRPGPCDVCDTADTLLVNRVRLYTPDPDAHLVVVDLKRRAQQRERKAETPVEDLEAVPNAKGRLLNPPCCLSCAKKYLLAREALHEAF